MKSFIAKRNDRRTIRHAAQLQCEVVREADFCRIGTRTLDVSTDGMRVAIDECEEVCVGDELFVAVKLPAHVDLWFDARATVTRVAHGRRPEDKGPEIGIRFNNMSAITKLILKGAVRKVPPPLPKRAARVDYAESVKRVA
jgi:hypothetical protein